MKYGKELRVGFNEETVNARAALEVDNRNRPDVSVVMIDANLDKNINNDDRNDDGSISSYIETVYSEDLKSNNDNDVAKRAKRGEVRSRTSFDRADSIFQEDLERQGGIK